jgi:hypothetical protein
MASLPWIDFLRDHSKAHLVVGVVTSTASSSHLTRLRRLLNELIARQSPQGAFSTAVVRQTGETEIHCGFAEQADADRLASIVKARRPRSGAGLRGDWASERSFRLDAATEFALAGAVASRGEIDER